MLRRITIFAIVITILASVCVPMVSAASYDLTGKVIILDPGHGPSTTNRYAGYDEQVTMLRLALKIKPLLEARGATVLMTRPNSSDVSLPVRAAMINIWALEAVKEARLQDAADNGFEAEGIAEIERLLDIMQSIIDETDEALATVYMNYPYDRQRSIHPDLAKVFELQDDPVIADRFLVISLHSNATGRPIRTAENGADVFHISNSNRDTPNYYPDYSYGEQSRFFGSILLNRIAETGIRKRNVSSSNLFMVREHNVPGVLAENGYHTNTADREKLQSDMFLDKLALAYLNAVGSYFDKLLSPDDQVLSSTYPGQVSNTEPQGPEHSIIRAGALLFLRYRLLRYFA